MSSSSAVQSVQLIGLSSYAEFDLMPSFGITHDGSRIIGHPEVQLKTRKGSKILPGRAPPPRGATQIDND